jgi:CBS domain containing-hemolysin-like protein
MESSLAWLFLVGCVLLVGLFAASEAALAATNRVRLRQLLRAQSDAAQSESEASAGVGESGERTRTGALSGKDQRFIATVSIAANIPLIGAAVLTLWLARQANPGGEWWQVLAVCAGAAGAIVSLFQVAPRLVAAHSSSNRLWWVRPARLIVLLLSPLVSLLLALATLVLRPLGLLPTRQARVGDGEGGLENADEIRDLVESAQESGVGAESRELIASIFTFGDTRVHEVMLPRPDIVALPHDAAWDEVFDTLQSSGLSRLPVYEGSVDSIVGVLHAKDLLKELGERETLDGLGLRDIMREPLWLFESTKIDEALETMRARRSHLALVADEFGGTAGLLTIEDILEELVGEIADEHDAPEAEPLEILDANRALAAARLHVEDLKTEWNLTLPPGEADTVGGFVIEQLGRAPTVGDRVETDVATLSVHTMRGRRASTILIQRKETAAEEEE